MCGVPPNDSRCVCVGYHCLYAAMVGSRPTQKPLPTERTPLPYSIHSHSPPHNIESLPTLHPAIVSGISLAISSQPGYIHRQPTSSPPPVIFTIMPPPPRPPPAQQQTIKTPKYKALLTGRFGRSLIVAEAMAFVGTGMLYYTLTTSEEAREKLTKRMPILMDVFHKVTQEKYKNIKGVGSEPQ